MSLPSFDHPAAVMGVRPPGNLDFTGMTPFCFLVSSAVHKRIVESAAAVRNVDLSSGCQRASVSAAVCPLFKDRQCV